MAGSMHALVADNWPACSFGKCGEARRELVWTCRPVLHPTPDALVVPPWETHERFERIRTQALQRRGDAPGDGALWSIQLSSRMYANGIPALVAAACTAVRALSGFDELPEK